MNQMVWLMVAITFHLYIMFLLLQAYLWTLITKQLSKMEQGFCTKFIKCMKVSPAWETFKWDPYQYVLTAEHCSINSSYVRRVSYNQFLLLGGMWVLGIKSYEMLCCYISNFTGFRLAFSTRDGQKLQSYQLSNPLKKKGGITVYHLAVNIVPITR